MPDIFNPRVSKSLTIASATSISSGVDLEGYRIAAIDISSGWDAANKMTFRVSQDGTSYFDLYDDGGTEYAIASGAPIVSSTGRSIVPGSALALALMSHRWIKFQSGPSSAPVNLTTSVSLTVNLMPL